MVYLNERMNGYELATFGKSVESDKQVDSNTYHIFSIKTIKWEENIECNSSELCNVLEKI